jgi:5-methylthioadenosine/S-adenosylhomocysteine deaminase
MEDLLIRNTLAVLPGENGPEGVPCSVAVKDGLVSAVLPAETDCAAKTVLDGRCGLLTPGLVNAHAHAYMTGMRNWADDLSFNDWLFGRVMPKEDAMRPEDA